MVWSIILISFLLFVVVLFFFILFTRETLGIPLNLSDKSSVIAEMDLAVDKFSQWTGYWLSIISCIIALFTIIQAYTNYQSREDTKREIEEKKEEFEKQKEELKVQNKEYEKKFIELSEEMRSSAYQNRLSCISACISTFPDAFSLTPTSERQRFTESFLKMLFKEYEEYTNYVKMAIDLAIDCMKVCKESGSSMHIDLSKEMGYVYLIWCDISIAVNHAMNDFSSVDQNIAFNDLKDLLSTAIRDYHDKIINPTNVAERMLDIKEAMRQLIKIL